MTVGLDSLEDTGHVRVYIWPPRGAVGSGETRGTLLGAVYTVHVARGTGGAASVQHLQVPSVAAADVGVNRGSAVVHLVELLTGLREILQCLENALFGCKDP